MKKHTRLLAAAAALAMLQTPAMAEKDCWYYAQNGVHDFEQTDFSYGTCTEDGYYMIECRQCGYNRKEVTMPATGHSWKEVRRTEATDTSMGSVVQECAECGERKTTSFYPDDALYRGTKDSDGVKELQLMLVELGYLNDSIDGKFGKNTEAAVKAFQSDYGFEADGVAWPQTIRFIEAAWEQMKYPSGSQIGAMISFDNLPETYGDGSYAPFCYNWENIDGTTVCEYCQKHAEMFATAVDLLSYGDAESALYSYGMWQQEIIALYDTWLMQLPENAKSGVSASRAVCISFMETQRSAMMDSYMALGTEIDPIDVEYGMELWMRAHVSWLCQMLSTLTEG